MDRSAHHPLDPIGRRRAYALAAVTFAAIAMWGSWYPFAWRAVPVDDAVALLRLSLHPDQLSLTDALSNLLLFVPIGLFAAAATSPQHRSRVVAVGITFSAALEFGQALVPWRTPSILDIAFETLGLIAGMVLCRLIAARLDALASHAIQAWRDAPRVDRVLMGYAALFVLAWLVPFDFTIRPDEIVDKYMHKRLLLPWVPSPDAASSLELWLTAAAAVPLGAVSLRCIRRRDTRRSLMTALAIITAAVAALALTQAAVFSRTTDTRVALVAIGGAAAGAVGTTGLVAPAWALVRRQS